MANILRIGMGENSAKAPRRILLERAGHTVTEASDVRQLVAACSGVQFDLIIIGHTLPAKEKLRVRTLVQEHSRGTKVLELHSAPEPDLEDADAYLHVNGDAAEELSRSVDRLIARRESA
jgi:PleD family two-component response regulator